jgi:GNAT superfamily N-acetyltransferase
VTGAGQVRVRRLVEDDLPVFLELVDALADYEHLPRPDAAARQRLSADALASPPRFHTLLAELGGRAVGYAVYFFTYSTFRASPTLYLEDIFVRAEDRGRGAGLALFRACAREAVRQACGRMEWQVLSWNAPSIDFYRRLGARHLVEWQPFRLEADALALVANAPGAE